MALTSLIFSGTMLHAQGALRGTVVGGGGPLPYAVVLLLPGYLHQFAGEDGSFAFAPLDSGSYRIVVRQIGYAPFDSTVTLGAGQRDLRVELHRIVVTLPAIRVGTAWRCDDPGPPDPRRDPEFAALFEQLRSAAARRRVLADEYPYRYAIARVVSQRLDDGHIEVAARDTVEFTSAERWRYRPGLPADWGNGRVARMQLVHLADLADLADSTFGRNHCFRYGGIDTIDAEPRIRIDFRSAANARGADLNGEAWLEPGTYELRRLHIVMTNPRRAVPGVVDFSATVVFREALPSVVVIDQLHAAAQWDHQRYGVVQQSIDQRLVKVDFGGRLVGR